MNRPREERPRFRLSASTIILSVLVGVMLALPFKIIKEKNTEPVLQESRQGLASRMTKLEEENEQLKAELTQTRQHTDNLEKALLEREEASTELVETRKMYRTLAGLDPVHGSGIKLTLSEEQLNIPYGSEAEQYLIHQEDLLNIVNEMWLAGAEAITIASGTKIERLVMNSTIRCVGSLIDINNTRMTPPFEISAIGNSDNLYNALTMPGGVLEPLRYFNIRADIVRLDDISLPAYTGSTLLNYTKPVEDKSGDREG
ncbi:MAG: DUF881 domain-containing protein [bacterium]